MHSEMTISVEAVRHLLDVNGVKFTPQRYSLVAFLMENASHPTAVEIFDGVNRLDPRSSKATVYRNLRDLVDAGLVREVAVEGRSARFDLKGIQHHHFICDGCGKVENLDWFDVPMPPAKVAGNRIVREYELILRGLCDACASPSSHVPDTRTTSGEPRAN
jgi:Fur family peroxide stress response transcriptional regulator